MARKAAYVLAYDVSNPKRLRQTHQHLKKWGLPIQYSVFAVDLTEAAAERLFRGLCKIVDPKEDDVRLYRISGASGKWFGLSPTPEGVLLTGSPSADALLQMAERGGAANGAPNQEEN